MAKYRKKIRHRSKTTRRRSKVRGKVSPRILMFRRLIAKGHSPKRARMILRRYLRLRATSQMHHSAGWYEAARSARYEGSERRVQLQDAIARANRQGVLSNAEAEHALRLMKSF